jgi:hypothetical protein
MNAAPFADWLAEIGIENAPPREGENRTERGLLHKRQEQARRAIAERALTVDALPLGASFSARIARDAPGALPPNGGKEVIPAGDDRRRALAESLYLLSVADAFRLERLEALHRAETQLVDAIEAATTASADLVAATHVVEMAARTVAIWRDLLEQEAA